MTKAEKKDILFLCQFFYPEYNSSAALPFDTAKYLASHGFSVGALCGYPKEYSNENDVPLAETVDSVEIKRLKYAQLKRTNKFGRLINYFSFTFHVWTHRRYLKDYKCVVVYSNPPILPYVPVIAKKKYGTKLVFVAYDVYPEVAFASLSLTPGSLISKIMNKLNHRLYGSVDRVVALTDEMKEFLLKNRPELNRERVTTIANWAHEKKVAADHGAYARFGYQYGQFVVSYFGNMGTCQDMETLIGAAKELKDDDRVHFLIVGHGNKKEHVQASTAALPNVQVMDYLTGKDFEQAVAVSSVAVVSLEKGLMGTCAPSKYYSYLQGGQPVLAVVENGSYLAEEVERERIGHAVEIGDVDGLVRAIQSMAEDRDACSEMGRRAEKLYKERYALEIGLGKYADMLKNTIEEQEL